MLRNVIKLTMLPVMALSLVIAACDTPGESPLTGPQVSEPSLNTVLTVQYRPLKGAYPSKTRINETVVQPTAGGNIGVAGHAVNIPAGAVLKPTLFRMEHVSTNTDGTTQVEVFLTAWQQDSRGKYTVSVGEKGFLLPVQLRMTADWVTDSYDPSQVRIVWNRPDGTQEAQLTTRGTDGRFHADLMHFSDYMLAMP